MAGEGHPMKNKHYGETEDMAQKVRSMYYEGKTREQIASELGKSLSMVNKYFIMGGKVTPEEKAKHYQKRFLS